MHAVGKYLWVAALLLTACATVDVQTDHDRSVDFSRYSTYAWKQPPRTGNPLMDSRIVAAVDGQLFNRGWRKIPAERAQTALAADVTTRESQRVDTFHNNWGPGWHGWGWGGPVMTTARVVTYHIGTLVLDLYDVNTRNAIWRGTASDVLSRNPEKLQRSLDQGLIQMFANFPPGVPGARPN